MSLKKSKMSLLTHKHIFGCCKMQTVEIAQLGQIEAAATRPGDLVHISGVIRATMLGLAQKDTICF